LNKGITLNEHMIRYQQNSNFIYRKVIDEAILIPVHQNVADMNCIYSLNNVGGVIWEKLTEPATKSELQVHLLQEFDADSEVIAKDLERFIREMTEIGAIREV